MRVWLLVVIEPSRASSKC